MEKTVITRRAANSMRAKIKPPQVLKSLRRHRTSCLDYSDSRLPPPSLAPWYKNVIRICFFLTFCSFLSKTLPTILPKHDFYIFGFLESLRSLIAWSAIWFDKVSTLPKSITRRDRCGAPGSSNRSKLTSCSKSHPGAFSDIFWAFLGWVTGFSLGSWACACWVDYFFPIGFAQTRPFWSFFDYWLLM